MAERRLVVTPRGKSNASCRLADFLWLGEEPAYAQLQGARGESWLERSHAANVGADNVTRWLERYAIGAQGQLKVLEHIRFEVGSDRFVEEGLYRSHGANEHKLPIVLPAEVIVGCSYEPMAGVDAKVSLMHAGPATLALAGQQVHVDGALLRGQFGGVARDQWLIRGVGEVALGPADAPPDRWVVCCSAGEFQLFGGVERSLREAVRPPLPRPRYAPKKASLF